MTDALDELDMTNTALDSMISEHITVPIDYLACFERFYFAMMTFEVSNRNVTHSVPVSEGLSKT